MDSTNDMVLQSMRMAAWERAKGELKSIGYMMYDPERKHKSEIDKYRDLMEKFIETVEDEGLIEGV